LFYGELNNLEVLLSLKGIDFYPLNGFDAIMMCVTCTIYLYSVGAYICV